MKIFWWFVVYSFLGFGLEVVYSRATRQRKKDRKCYLLLPLCPVYGLGAVGILALPDRIGENLFLLWLVGGLVATAAEYLMGLFYEKALGVAFWDYSDRKGNLGGKVCPLFAFFWGGLAVALRWWLHPLLEPVIAAIPAGWTALGVALLTLDGFATLAILTATGDVSALRWYDRFRLSPALGESQRASGERGTRPPER